VYIQRNLEKILKKRLFGGKVIVLYGSRQAGKTTLVKHIVSEFGQKVRFIDCELLENRELLTHRKSAELFSLVEQYNIVVFDEAQVIPDIGSVLKTLYDHHPEVQYIATGSSSFDLANAVSEPLTGRALEFTLYPLSLAELAQNSFDAEARVSELMRFGGYPDLVGLPEEEKILRLKTLVSQYLYKNVLAIGGIKKPEVIIQLLKLLAFQMGNEVSYRELAAQLKTSQPTIERYIDLLEKSFVIIRLPSFAKNLRNEVTRSKKIYFVDLGIRNALIDAWKPIDPLLRNDVGALFEACMITERMKHVAHEGQAPHAHYFWRMFSGQEIDYIEEREGQYVAFEFKWNGAKIPVVPRAFAQAYPDVEFIPVSPRTALPFLVGENSAK
jgi:predicted AAA+ superfamily ATPase